MSRLRATNLWMSNPSALDGARDTVQSPMQILCEKGRLRGIAGYIPSEILELVEELNMDRHDAAKRAETCSLCGHSLKDNSHGFDQNDAHMDGDKLVHSGHCTYCKEC